MSTLYPHKILLLRTGFQSPERPLLYGRASLYFDRMELSGWRLNRRFRETIPIDGIRCAAWDASDERMLRLHVDGDGERVLQLSHPRRWRGALELRLSWMQRYRPSSTFDRMSSSLNELALVASSIS